MTRIKFVPNLCCAKKDLLKKCKEVKRKTRFEIMCMRGNERGGKKIIAFREVGEQREDTTRAKGLRRDLTTFEWFDKVVLVFYYKLPAE